MFFLAARICLQVFSFDIDSFYDITDEPDVIAVLPVFHLFSFDVQVPVRVAAVPRRTRVMMEVRLVLA